MALSCGLRAIVAALASITAIGCASPTPALTPPDRLADITGTVTRVSRSDGVLPTILVEEVPADSTGSAKAAVRLTSRTVLQHANGDVAGSADVRTGARVRVWFDGPVMESYPVQGTAGTLVLDSGAR